MTRSTGSSVQNSFVKGLVTESTTLNFPEQACTDTDNCKFEIIGNVTRRDGIDFEDSHSNLTKDLTGNAISNYFWKSVAGNGAYNFVVSQIGNTLYFYRVSASPLSSGIHAFTVDLTTFAAGGVTTVSTLECQYAAGNGFLFVVNQNCDPFYVSYDIASDSFTTTRLTLQTRDFKGIIEAGVLDTDHPLTLTAAHRYNLGNQGWTSNFVASSVTSITIGTGAKVFTTQANLVLRAGDRIRIYSNALPGLLGTSLTTGNIMIGVVSSYIGTTLTVNVTSTNGAGTFTDWFIVQEPDYIEAWFVNQGNYPSNSDVWWLNLDSSNPPQFVPNTKGIANIPGSSAANKGHYILNPFAEDRASASGQPISTISTGAERPTVVAFHAGRVWYSGVNYQGFNARIYFSQIVTNTTVGATQYANCYQQNDPTSQNFPELLPDDGGVVDIIDCGIIYKMVPVMNALLIIASNGVWAIRGNQGIGFTANDFSIPQVSTIRNTSGTSVVDVEGIPMWWNFDGIWAVTLDPQTNAMRTQSITFQTVNSFYETIPLDSISLARGAYDHKTKVIEWIYKSNAADTFADKYVFDRTLCYNTVTKAFYTWSFDTSNVRINSIVNTTGLTGSFGIAQVTANAGVDNVQANSGADNVVVFASASTTIPSQFKYLCSFLSGGSTKVTYGDMNTNNFVDWESFDSIGQTFSSFFRTGFMTRGDAQRKWQTNYVLIWSNPTVESVFSVQGIDDYARYSTTTVVTDPTNFRPKRIKLRGDGLTKQFLISSSGRNPFDIIGWSVFQSVNKWV